MSNQHTPVVPIICQPSVRARNTFTPMVCPVLSHMQQVCLEKVPRLREIDKGLLQSFPDLDVQHEWRLIVQPREPSRPLRIGVLFSGGPAPGGHNVVAGIFDALKEIHPSSHLIGFLGGFAGLIEDHHLDISEPHLRSYRNMGGFDLLRTGRTKVHTREQIESCKKHVQRHLLDGLIVIGGDDSHTNAAMLAQEFANASIGTTIVGVPKTIDGDMKGEGIEQSFGHDTACRVYSELASNIARDCLSSPDCYHIVRLMGRSASHIALECALQVQPTLTLISEEIAQRRLTLQQVCEQIAQLILHRSKNGLHHGIILIPEGLLEFIPDIKEMINRLHVCVNSGCLRYDQIMEALAEYQAIFASLPSEIQEQLLAERDPHGNIRLSQIETEKLLAKFIQSILRNYGVQLDIVGHFLGYEARAAMPTNFDLCYSYCLGKTAVALARDGANGTIAAISQLVDRPMHWLPKGIPYPSLMHFEKRLNEKRPVIAKSLVNLSSPSYQYFALHRHRWANMDCFCYRGPNQYSVEDDWGPLALKLDYGHSIGENK